MTPDKLVRPTPRGKAGDPCELHLFHVPALVAGPDLHHIVPQAWQHVYVPQAPQPFADGLLWDDRTVALCATTHHNVHAFIVMLMRSVARSGSEDPRDARRDVFGRASLSRERKCALLSLERFVEAGGSLIRLVQLNQMGWA